MKLNWVVIKHVNWTPSWPDIVLTKWMMGECFRIYEKVDGGWGKKERKRAASRLCTSKYQKPPPYIGRWSHVCTWSCLDPLQDYSSLWFSGVQSLIYPSYVVVLLISWRPVAVTNWSRIFKSSLPHFLPSSEQKRYLFLSLSLSLLEAPEGGGWGILQVKVVRLLGCLSLCRRKQ